MCLGLINNCLIRRSRDRIANGLLSSDPLCFPNQKLVLYI